jgi:hypothetical protein
MKYLSYRCINEELSSNITQTTLNDLYSLWTEKGSVGYYVFVLNMSYVDALEAATTFARTIIEEILGCPSNDSYIYT